MVRSPTISILIPTWNNLPMLRLCVESLSRHSRLARQLVVHVNDGSDGTLEWVRGQGLDYTHTPENVGICRALNMAAQSSVGEYLVYLNDDMYVLPGWDVVLHDAMRGDGHDAPAYFSGTMVQSYAMAPSVVLADYGADPESFDEASLLRDFGAGKLGRSDWNGATWPPCCIHRKWWERVGGYSEDMSPGFYSDLDFSMKLWQLGCRRFHGVGASLVYHFGEKTTTLVRGPKGKNVRDARIQFLRKWGVLPSTFSRYYLHAGESYQIRTSEPQLKWERVRVAALATAYRWPLRRAA